ncbi:MAG: hypothetical protein M1476_07405 [Candidatus Thermoplasmatota archaeon]|nr:hypothetical protein [Candidatus Thermoplasmatota archaeon]
MGLKDWILLTEVFRHKARRNYPNFLAKLNKSLENKFSPVTRLIIITVKNTLMMVRSAVIMAMYLIFIEIIMRAYPEITRKNIILPRREFIL